MQMYILYINTCLYIKLIKHFKVTKQLTVVDNHIEKLINGLKQSNILGCVNIIIVSDHGMANMPDKSVIKLKKYIPDLNEVAKVFYGPFTSIRPYDDNLGIYRKIQYFIPPIYN